jgi:hypothetical protein
MCDGASPVWFMQDGSRSLRMSQKGIIAAALLILVSFGILDAVAQDNYRSGVIKTRTGYLVICNEPNNWYTIEIKGTDVRQTSTARKTFTVDRMFLQIVTANTGKFIGEQEKRTLDERAILQAHRDWEAKYSEGSYKEKLTIESSWRKLDNGKDALLWTFKVPESARTSVKKEIYLTVVKGDYVLMLGGIVTDDINEETSIRLLVSTMSSLKASDKPIDMRQLQESIRKGN